MSDESNSPPFPHSLEFINCTPSSPVSNGESFIVKQEVDEESFILNQEDDKKFEPDPLCIEPSISDTSTEGTLINFNDGIKVEDPKPCYETLIYNVQIHHKIKNGQKVYLCTECSLRRKRKEDIFKHLIERHKIHKEHKCKFCGQKSPVFSLLRDHLKSHKNIFICTVCEYYTNNSRTIRTHLKIHNLTLYNCKLCNKSYNTIKELRVHEKEYHSKQDILNCAHCNYSNTDKSFLKIHIISQHFSKFLYRCNLCNKGYISKSEFKKHQEDHENGKTNTNKSDKQIYCCKFCFYTTTFLSVVTRHMGVCDNKKFPLIKINTYKCKKCPDVFENARELRTHAREKHSSIIYFHCEHCTFLSASKRSFNLHFTLKHMDGGPTFKCSLCPFVTPLKCILSGHEKAHQKVRKRYVCSTCQYFTYKYNLYRKHLRIRQH